MSRSFKQFGLLAHHAQGGACLTACAALVFVLLVGGCATKGGWLEYRTTTTRPSGERVEERLSVAQPDNPAREATFERKADGAAKVAVPPAYKPADPPTPASKALGWLIWLGGGCVLIGCVLAVMRLSGWSVLAAAPKGIGYGLVAGGGLLIAVAVAFDSNPLWAVGAAITGVAVAVMVGYWDNIKQALAREKAAGEAVTTTTTTTTRTGSGLMDMQAEAITPPSEAQA